MCIYISNLPNINNLISIYLSVYLPIYLSIYLSIYLYIYTHTYIHIHLYIVNLGPDDGDLELEMLVA